MWLFYTPDIADDMELPQEEAGHCIRVLRMKEGDRLRLTDGKGCFYDAEITSATGKRCMVHILGKESQPRLWNGGTKTLFNGISLPMKNTTAFWI